MKNNSRVCLLIILSISILVPMSFASDEVNELGLGLGMASISYTENQTQLASTTGPASGTVSSIAASIYYKFYPFDNMAYYVSAIAPIISSGGNSYFNMAGGLEYYFGEGSHKLLVKKNNLKLSMLNQTRYFLFAEAGGSYMAYTTELARKNDTFFELGGGAGLSYSMGDWWALRGTAQAMRGIGVLTTPFVIKIFASFIYFLDTGFDS